MRSSFRTRPGDIVSLARGAGPGPGHRGLAGPGPGLHGLAGLLLVSLLVVPGPASASGAATDGAPVAGTPPRVVPALAAVAGLLLRGDGEAVPAAGLEVRLLRPPAEGGAIDRTTVSGADGRFAFPDVPAGSWVLEVVGLGVATTRMEFEHGEGATHLEVRVPFEILQLAGVVGTGHPLGRATRYQPARALGREELTERPGLSVGSMLDGEPGVAMRSLGPAPARPVIRGFDGDRILVLENGERMGDLAESAADHAVALDPLAIRRIEVVRGPASLLYGSSALGGVVNLLTSDLPANWDPGWTGEAQVQGATMNRMAAAAASGVFGGEGWAATGRLSARETGDVRTPQSILPGTDLQSMDGQVGIVVRGEEAGLGLSASFTDRGYGIPDALEDPGEDVRLTMARQALQARFDWAPTGNGFLRSLELRGNVARYAQQELERTLGPGGRVEAEEVELEFDQVAGSVSITLGHRPMGFLDEGAVGVAMRGRTLEVGGGDAFTPGVEERSLALFVFQEAPLVPGVRLQFGLRGEAHESRTLPNAQFPDAAARRRGPAISGSLGLNWSSGPEWEAGAQVARAHRHPSVEELHADGPHLGAGAYEIGDPGLEDEIGVGADLFLRRGWTRGAVEAALFVNRIRGFVAVQPQGEIDPGSGLPVFRYEGTGARLFGGELTGEWRPTPAVHLAAGLDMVRGDRRGDGGGPLPTMPPFRGRLQARYDPGSWWMGSTLRAVAAQSRVAPEEEPTGGYALVDAHAGLRLDRSGRRLVVFRVDNLTNRLYRDHLSRIEERGVPMPGRNLSVAIRVGF